MGLKESIKEKCILTNCRITDKSLIIKKIAEFAKKSKILKSVKEKEIIEGLTKREEIGSTAFGKGIAIPHCTLKDISEFVIGIITTPKGANFNSLDGKKTKLFVFIFSPVDKRNQHIRILSGISRILHKEGLLDRIVSIKEPAELKQELLKNIDIDIKAKPEEENFLFYINVQIEDKFEEILSIFAELHNCYVSVLEVNDATYYLQKLPLFAYFWSEKTTGFNRLIIATVNKSFSNEIIRRIDMIIDQLGDKPGVMIMVQKLFYFNGSLNI